MRKFKVTVFEKKKMILITEVEVESNSKIEAIKTVNTWLQDGTINNPSNLYGWGVRIDIKEI